MSDSEDPIDIADEGGDDLFGDDDEDRAPSENERAVSDGLASDPEDDGYRRNEPNEDDQQVRDKVILNVQINRHRIPKPQNEKLQSLRAPTFLKWIPVEYKSETFEPSEFDKVNMQADNPKPTIRYRRDPKTGELKSNALIYKWSDGSVTVSVGSEHYEIQTKQMAPPADKPYQELQDSHYYAAAAHLSSNLLLTVGHVQEQLTILPSRNIQDDALARLTSRMAAVARNNKGEDMIIATTRDPELQKKEAELAEKERAKAERRRENAAARMESRATGHRSGGLSINDLEGGRRAGGGGRKRGVPGAPRPKKRRPDYDSDDDLPPGNRREDEYDMEDDFIVASEDEISEEGGDDDEEDILDDDEEEAPRKKRQRTAERDDDVDADGEADLDDVDAPVTAGDRRHRRHVIDDDDEEE